MRTNTPPWYLSGDHPWTKNLTLDCWWMMMIASLWHSFGTQPVRPSLMRAGRCFFSDGGATLFDHRPKKRSLCRAGRWQKGGATVPKTAARGKTSKYGCHTFWGFGRWQEEKINCGETLYCSVISNYFAISSTNCTLLTFTLAITMDTCHGKSSNEDDDAILAFFLAQDGLLFEEFMEVPTEAGANGNG